jgi:hypothetical protein
LCICGGFVTDDPTTFAGEVFAEGDRPCCPRCGPNDAPCLTPGCACHSSDRRAASFAFLDACFEGVSFTFGLQPKDRATVTRMLGEGCDWPEIGRIVGWEPGTLREFYEDGAAEEKAP